MFTCEKCNYNTKIKCNYLKHLNTKKHFNNVKSEEKLTSKNKKYKKMTTNDHKMTTNEHKMTKNEHKIKESNIETKKQQCSFKCKYCGKSFKTKPSMRRHELHYCKKNNSEIPLQSIINKKELELKNEKKEKKKLYKHIESLLEKVGDTINNNTINQTNNIVLNNYGNEDLSHITSRVLDKLIMSPCQMISNLTRMIHFNREKPENMNIYIPNKKEKYIKIFKDDQWILENKKDRIPDLVDKNYFILDNHYEEGGEDKLDKFTNKSYKDLQKKIDKKDDYTHKIEYDACELEILNNTKLVMDQHNLK